MFDFHIYVWLHVLANFYDIFIQTFPQRGHKQTPAIDVWTKMSILWDWILGLKARLCNIDDSDDEMGGGDLQIFVLHLHLRPTYLRVNTKIVFSPTYLLVKITCFFLFLLHGRHLPT